MGKRTNEEDIWLCGTRVLLVVQANIEKRDVTDITCYNFPRT